MRILQAFEPPHGGVAQHVCSLTTELVERGHDVEVFGPSESKICDELERAGVPVTRAALTGSILSPRLDLAAGRRLRKLMRGGRFDVAHGHGVKGGALLRALRPLTRVPVVYTPHCFAFISNEHRGDLRHPRLRRALVVNAERLMGLLTARLVCVSDFERAYADRLHVVPSRRRRTIYNGARLRPGGILDPVLSEWRDGGVLAGTVAVLRWEKGLGHIPRAASLTVGAPGLRWAIVGDGAEREAIEAEIERLGVADRVRLFPFSGEVEPHLLGLDVFVLPSDQFEAQPIALIEAMLAGLPVVASRIGGVPELVEDGVTGVLLPPGDEAAIGATVSELALDEGRRRAMGAASLSLAERKFSLSVMVDRLEAEYASLSA